MLEVQKYLRNLVEQNSDLSHDSAVEKALEILYNEYGIENKLYPDSVILNYGITAKNPTAQIVKECRALQLSTADFTVISRAFDRFFNYGEADTASSFRFKDIQVLEKLDGTLCIFYYHGDEWKVRTRKTAYGEGFIGSSEVSYREQINELFKNGGIDITLKSANLEPSKSYVFEFVSPENKIVTPYPEKMLFFLSSFNNETGEETPYEEAFLEIEGVIPCQKPQIFNFTSASEIMKEAKELPPVQEGYVVRNYLNQRVKIKNPVYVTLHHLRFSGELTNKRILEIIESAEVSEYLTYFPDDQEKFDHVLKIRDDFLAVVQKTFSKIQHFETQKEFALEAIKYPFSALLFGLRQGISLDELWKTKTKLQKKIDYLKL